MNMIPTGAFLTEMDASEKKETLAEQFVSIWEKKNSKIARAGGVSLMALSLAACGGSSDTAATDTPAAETPAEETETPAAETPAEETPAEEEVVEEVTPVVTELAVSSLTAETTMKTTDDLDGGDGTADELSLSLSADFAGFVVSADAADTGSMVGYEVVSLSADALARSFDATGVSGVETYKIDGSNGGVVSIADSADLAAIELSNIASGAFSITYAAPTGGTSPVAGTADTLDLTVEGLGSATADIAITAAGVETLAVTSNAAASAAGATNYLNTASVGAATVTVAGAADTDFGAVSTSTTSFDASAATGAVTAALGNAGDSALTSVKTGSGDDSVTVDLNDLTATATVDMGAGDDTLTATSTASETFQLAMSGVETIDVTDVAIGTTATISLANTTDLATITAGSAAGTNDFGTGGVVSVDFVNASGAMTISTAGESTASTISTDTTGAVTLNIADDAQSKAITAGGNDASLAIFEADKTAALSVNVSGNIDQTGNISADKASSVTVTTSAFTQSDIDIDAAKAETVTITSGGTAAYNTSSDFSGAKVVTVDSTKTTTIGDLAALQTATLSGAGSKAAVTLGNLGASDLSYNTTVTATGLKSGFETGTIQTAGAATVDASAVTGTTTVGAITSTGAASVTGGTGAVSLGAIDASAVTLNFAAGTSTSAVGAITTGGTVDVTANAVTAITGTVGITGDKTSVTLTATGSLGADKYTLANSTEAGFTGFTVSGDFGLGADTIGITVRDADLAAGASGDVTQTIDVSGVVNAVTTITVNDQTAGTAGPEAGDYLVIKGSKDTTNAAADAKTNVTFGTSDTFTQVTLTDVDEIDFTTALSLNASAVSGGTIELTGGGSALTLTGTAAANTLDVSNITSSGSDTLTIDLAAGADSITLGALSESVDLDADAADTITSFTAGAAASDTVSVSAGATLVGSTSVNLDVALTAASGSAVDTAAYEVIGVTDEAAADWSDVTTIIDAAITVAADVTAANAATAIAIDNGTDTRIYLFSDDATSNTTVEATELTHIGTLVAVEVGDLNANDFVA